MTECGKKERYLSKDNWVATETNGIQAGKPYFLSVITLYLVRFEQDNMSWFFAAVTFDSLLWVSFFPNFAIL